MKLMNLMLTVLAIGFFTTTGAAQSAKLLEKAAEKVQELNDQISSVNAALALTDEQTSALTELYVERLHEARKMKKAGEDEEAIKAFRKENWLQIKAVLTKEQFKARKEAKSDDDN